MATAKTKRTVAARKRKAVAKRKPLPAEGAHKTLGELSDDEFAEMFPPSPLDKELAGLMQPTGPTLGSLVAQDPPTLPDDFEHPLHRLCRLVEAATRSAAEPDKPEPVQFIDSKKWLADELERMKKDNEIPSGIGITDLSKILEPRMKTAAATNKSIRPIKARSIENGLRIWSFWPIS